MEESVSLALATAKIILIVGIQFLTVGKFVEPSADGCKKALQRPSKKALQRTFPPSEISSEGSFESISEAHRKPQSAKSLNRAARCGWAVRVSRKGRTFTVPSIVSEPPSLNKYTLFSLRAHIGGGSAACDAHSTQVLSPEMLRADSWDRGIEVDSAVHAVAPF